MKKKWKTLASFAFVCAMAFLFAAQPVKAAEDITVYATIEKFALGQGFLIEPTKMTVAKDALASDVIVKLLEANGYEYEVDTSWGYQLTYIKNADNGTVDIPACIAGMAADSWSGTPAPTTESAKAAGNASAPDLGNYSYTSAAGWTFYVNNESPIVPMSEYKLQNGDVLRLRFTIHGYGADMGGTWDGCLTLPNLDTLIKKMANYNASKKVCDMNATYKKAYANAIKTAADMDNNQTAMDKADTKLPSNSKINSWVKKVKNNTPKKVTLKSVKNTTSTKVKVTWKKVSKASGYEIYYKVKGSKAEYKKLKTVKKVSTVTATTKKLKKNKTYSFKIRAYKTVSGNKIYGKFSAVKNLKVK